MINIVDIFVIVLVLLNIVFLCIGYLLGKTTLKNLDTVSSNILSSKENRSIVSKNRIEIDDTKVVTKINIDNLEKKYGELAETKNTSENISSSVNKLKNMKG